MRCLSEELLTLSLKVCVRQCLSFPCILMLENVFYHILQLLSHIDPTGHDCDTILLHPMHSIIPHQERFRSRVFCSCSTEPASTWRGSQGAGQSWKQGCHIKSCDFPIPRSNLSSSMVTNIL